MIPVILVHGGAGDVPDERIPAKILGVKKSVEIGYRILKNNGTAVDAVEAAVKYMEDGEAFNAGYGSVLNLDGEVEMDASIMKTPHLLLAGVGANRFAKEQGIPTVSPGRLVTKYAQIALQQFKARGGDDRTEVGHNNPGDVGTVGAVALDSKGNLAAATSTGGHKWENGGKKQ
ncbi:hypothetical protein NQ314_003761 [Rhamnusium bicolor]|uniref:L-asparaginase n=1 Tax=Rhamnusium bicolor TaxID=1586634 RepID=A0AAV8ZMV7_9CUCU|nr:hypothetical protein NQ314_003761 [Rhamnusium bicolor]